MTTDMWSSPAKAETAIEELRRGTPPAGQLRQFTVGRSDELHHLADTLSRPQDGRGEALLVEANYGAGKTHLLRLIREEALDRGFAVALVTVDSQSAVRFNRMDQVTAAVIRQLEVDEWSSRGIGGLFDSFMQIDAQSLLGSDNERWTMLQNITDVGRWSRSSGLGSQALFVGLRAWVHGDHPQVREMVTDWLGNSWNYKSSRSDLYATLVGRVSGFRDSRSEKSYYTDSVFSFDSGGHHQAWSALADLDLLCRACGRRGLVILFDEFEDVIQNLNNIGYEQSAFDNLFRLFDGRDHPGTCYFAVTPDFSNKCRSRLYEKAIYSFPVERFDELERFRMTRITADDVQLLATRIRDVHGIAYEWDAAAELADLELRRVVDSVMATGSADQIRQAVIGIVKTLDERLES